MNIINWMLPTSLDFQIIQNLLIAIKNSHSFKNYHQASDGRGIFGLIKNTYEEMLLQLEKFVPNHKHQPYKEIFQRLKSGQKVWAYYEFKIFAWIVTWLQFQKLEPHPQNNNDDITFLQSFFPNKSQIYLRYEYLLLISKTDKIKCQWSQQQVQAFSKIINEFFNCRSTAKGTSWKFISFRLFAEEGFFKTPTQCRQRWSNYLNPKLSKTKWEPSENMKLLLVYQQVGPKWAYIARKLKNRTEHMVKNRFNSIKHKWMKAKKYNSIFNITALIREFQSMIKKKEESPSSSQFQEEEKLQGQKKEESQIHSQNEAQVLIEENSQSQSQSEMSANVHPAVLSLADVGCEMQLKTKPQKTDSYNQILSERRLCYQLLLDDPLWRKQDRISTSDYDWLEDMMEEQNMQYLNEYI